MSDNIAPGFESLVLVDPEPLTIDEATQTDDFQRASPALVGLLSNVLTYANRKLRSK